MKPARVAVVSVGVLAVLVLVLVVLALNSSVQTWAARRALEKRPDLNGTLGSVSVGFRRVEVRQLRAESEGAVLILPSMDVELPVVSAALSDRVAISKLVAKGWTLDLTQAKNLKTAVAQWSNSRARPAEVISSRGFSLLSTAVAAQPALDSVEPLFRGVFDGLKLPVDLSLEGADLAGEIILPDVGGRGAARLQVTIQGGGLGSGKEGTFSVNVAGAKPDGGSLTLQSTLKVEMDTPRTFTDFGVDADASASGVQIPEGVTLKINGAAHRNATGETYALRLAGSDKQLADINAELASATSRISGTWKLDVRDGDLVPFVLGRSLPTFTATGQGSFETGTALKEIHASGRLDASADRLDAIRSELAAIGAVSLTADFDVLQHGDSLRVERLDATITGVAPLAHVQALQSFEFNLGTGELHVANPAQDLVGLSLTGLPVAWARPFTGQLEFTGGHIRGEFAASARDGGLALRSVAPLVATNLSLTRSGDSVLSGVDLLLNASADYTPRGWQIEVVELTARAQDRTLLSLNAKAGKLVGDAESIKATGRWTADLPGWAQQPVAAGRFQLAAGLAQGDFNGSLDGTKAFGANVVLSNLVTAANEKLPLVNADIRVDVSAGGQTTFNTAVLFDQAGSKSDLLLSGTLKPEGTVTIVDARISSERVVLEEVKLLAAALPTEEKPETPLPDVPDELPFWGSLKGQATLNLKKVVYGGSYEVSDVVGVLRIEPDGLKLESMHAVFGPESELKLQGALAFDPKVAASYALAGEMALSNFDTSQAFLAFDPAKLPTVETRMNLNGTFSGTGENLVEVAEGAHGRFDLTSKGGIFRALATVLPESKLQATQSALSVVGGLFGGGSSGAEMIATANEIVKLVSEIQFDQLSVTAERDENMNLVLKDFTLIAPYIRLGGEGLITYTPGRSLLEQALDLRITLGARGRLGELLSQWKLLKAEKDNLGYTAFVTPIKVGGTVGNTDSRDLQAKLLNVALEKTGVGDALNRLLGGGKQ